MMKLPLQNRVDAWGQLQSVSNRGTLMGNRGILHNEARQVVRPWTHKAWVVCSTSYPGPQRIVFSSGNYSELFFLDEVTALAAGHRPCHTCQREKFIAFKEAWLTANLSNEKSSFVRVSEIDRVLHAERAIPGGGKITYEAVQSDLPNGVMFEHEGNAFLVWAGKILRWSFEGYVAVDNILIDKTMRVLTPKSIVNALRIGYIPDVLGFP